MSDPQSPTPWSSSCARRRSISSSASWSGTVGLCCGAATLLLVAIGCCVADTGLELSRMKRGLPFLQGSGNGYIIAIAVPINSGPRHVFTAFNFELHFGLADNSTFSPTALQTRWEGKRSIPDSPAENIAADEQQSAESTETKRPKKKSPNKMLTRKHAYRVIENQLFRAGFNGTACLLKTICNTAESDLYENNGVFGNLFHIVFTPSSSKDERIPQFFYDAEEHGRWHQCEHYAANCPKSLLEYVTKGFELFQ